MGNILQCSRRSLQQGITQSKISVVAEVGKASVDA